MLQNHGSFVEMLLDDDCRWGRDRIVVVELQRVSIVTGRNARVLQQPEQEVVAVHRGVIVAVVADDVVVLLGLLDCIIAFIQQKIHFAPESGLLSNPFVISQS